MSGVMIIIGLIWLVVELIKEASIKPAPPGMDYRAAISDCYRNNLSKREFNRRIDAGYYVRK